MDNPSLPTVHFHENLSPMIHVPHWWTQVFGWTAFIPKRAHLEGALLGILAHIPSNLDQVDGKYQLPAHVMNGWRNIECWLVNAMKGLSSFSALAPAYPSARGYLRAHASPSIALREARAAREIFVLWIGLFSYAVARADSTSYQQWHSFLVEKLQFHPSIIDLICASDIGTCTHESRRVGTFIHLNSKDIRDSCQPSIQWFVAHNIPVWYQWDKFEIKRAEGDPYLPSIGPLPHQIEFQREEALSHIPANLAMQYPNQIWEHFFQKRMERLPQLLFLEKPSECERRLNREQMQPTKTAQVFVWDKDPDHLVREEVLVREREETLLEYGSQQKVYNAFWNQWDCCHAFGSPDASSGEEDDYAYKDDNPIQNAEQYDETIEQPPPQQPIIQPMTEEDHENANRLPDHYEDTLKGPRFTLEGLVDQVQCILYEHYGLVTPEPFTSQRLPSLSNKEEKFWLQWIGLSPTNKNEDMLHQFWNLDLVRFWVAFTEEQQRHQDIQNINTDINMYHPDSLTKSKCLQQICYVINIYDNEHHNFNHKYKDDAKHIRNWYMFDFGLEATVPWKLVVTSASDALLVCRLDDQFLDVDIARYLAGRGIAFRTLASRAQIPISPSVPEVDFYLPSRPQDYVFTQADYEAYLYFRERMLRQPRIRAAILRGGYFWRLVIGSVSLDEILEGPIGGASMFSVEGDGKEFLDDKLSKHEMDLLCGTYMCETAQANEVAVKSWWPPYVILDNEYASEAYGKWNEWAEAIYTNPLAQIRSGNAEPCSTSKWRAFLKGHKESKKLMQQTETLAVNFIIKHRPELRTTLIKCTSEW
ncbi:hypothetical protein K443DRAFT_135642 [Laccaria amethystina LaAM-08-1]|uniref:Unplaced genomic scaffold K443scaffold_608, whole genome shotgun sequence n=1 Tax=Laccaria amethystina LaAM-08-1 TaxID=1095629 RepID=A0A0C9WH58_9AGAR|nr:hypothetical protein K443DRAFT_135642 [Laccaria amethystina LaAM-08-1]